MTRKWTWTLLILVVAGGFGWGCRGSKAPAADGHDHEHSEEAAAPSVPASPVKVTTSLDRTAVWVGDPVVWTVELVCPPTFNIVEEDLAPEKITLDGLEIISSETDKATTEDGSLLYRVRYRLRSFEIASKVLRTQAATPLKVRYYEHRPGQATDDLTPAGEVLVPGAVITWRSTLPDDMDRVGVRPERQPDAIPTILSVARPLGVVLVLLSVAPVAFWGFSKLREVRVPRQKRPSARVARGQTISALAELRMADTSTPEAVQDAFVRLDETLRRHVAATSNIPAGALAAGEFAQRMTSPSSRLSGADVAGVLADCARARFGRPEIPPTADQFNAALEATERLV